MEKKKRLAIDMDGVLCDLTAVWLQQYNNDYNDNLTPEDATCWGLEKIVKSDCGKKIYNYLENGKIFGDLPVIKDSQRIVEELSKEYELFVVTTPFNNRSIEPKSFWLRKHFPMINPKHFVFTWSKSIVMADYMLDDKPSNFDGFVGTGILFEAPHNRNETRYKRALDWEHVKWFLLGGG